MTVRMLGCALLAVFALTGTARALALADDMTCAQAIDHYQKNHVIYILVDGKFAIPLRVGVPVAEAATLQCAGQGQVPHGYQVRTRDKRSCTIAVKC